MKRQTVLPYPPDDHDHADSFNDLGLSADLNMLERSVIDRRKVLSLGLLGIGLLAGCGAVASTTSSGGTTSTTGSDTCPASAIPEETAGPYPADGSSASGQSLNVLTRSGIVRSDLRTSLATGNVAAGVPLTLTLKLVNIRSSCAPLAGYAVYAWHCTQGGEYSLYGSSVLGEDYLRGVQAAGADGTVTFRTIFPACYDGRWPHIHFEIYPSLTSATSASNKIQTSQLALPEATCRAVYATSGYSQSLTNLSRVSLSSDMVFRDGYASQIPSMGGDPSAGCTANLTVGLAR